MEILLIVFGLLSGCLFSMLVGIVGSRRRIGFGIPFLLSLLFTPLIGLLAALLSSPLPGGNTRWGCLGTLVSIMAFLCLAAFVLIGVLLLAAV